MASDVNITLTNYRNGTNVTVQRKLVDYSVTWVDNNNQPQGASGTLTFPDILNNPALPAGWLRNELEQLVIRAGRIIIGIDEV